MTEHAHRPVFRFAPSPNGRLHLGHAWSALLNSELARRMGGRLLVRMEDIDPTRCTPELARLCLEDLAWLGLAWEEPVRVQSEHMEEYAQALEKLTAQGLLYPCFCSRKEIAQSNSGTDPDGAPIYPRTCAYIHREEAQARIASGEAHSWRLDMEKALKAVAAPYIYKRFDPLTGAVADVAADPARWGDAVLARKDVAASYHLCVVVDDALQAVTHVVRGKDLEASTDIHIVLQRLLALPSPLYYHHALIMLPEGGKLAKSKGSQPLAELRAQGLSPQQVRELLPAM